MAHWTKQIEDSVKNDVDKIDALDGGAERETAIKAVISAMDPVYWEQLEQLLFTGPVWDGNIASKSHRSDLIAVGLATRCCYKGQQGYTICTYAAFPVWRDSKRTRSRTAA